MTRRASSWLLLVALLAATTPAKNPSRGLGERDEKLLEDLSRRSFLYFWEQEDAGTGLVADRAHADGSPIDRARPAVRSIAATGFGLTALCIGAERGWVGRAEARQRAKTALHFFASRAFQKHGWFYHWMDSSSGERVWKSEVSSIDSALLLAGILTARQCFAEDPDIVGTARQIYERVDFAWMLNGSPALLSHGWTPESGFLPSRWDNYSEETLLYLLAIGSPTHPIPPASWREFARPKMTFEGLTYVSGAPPLFIHQFSHAWVDYRGRRDSSGDHMDYFENSITATRAHRLFCLNLSSQFPKSYSGDVWGISASDSARGYVAWGGPPRDPRLDGTVVPYASAGSLMFTPELSLAALRAIRSRFGERIYGRYGFVDAFNPTTGWTDTDVIGIDIGITLLSAENLRSGNVWRWFMANPEPRRAMSLAGLK